MSGMKPIMESWRSYLNETKLINKTDIRILAKGIILPGRSTSAPRFFVIVEYDIKNILERYQVRGYRHEGVTNMVPEKEQVMYYASSGTATPGISSFGQFWPVGGVDYGGNVASWIKKPFEGWIVKMRMRKKVDENTVAKYVSDYLSEKFPPREIFNQMREVTKLKFPGIKVTGVRSVKKGANASREYEARLIAKGSNKAWHLYFDKKDMQNLVYPNADKVNRGTVKKIEQRYPKSIRYDVKKHYPPFYWGDLPLDRDKIGEFVKFAAEKTKEFNQGKKINLG